MPDEMPAESSPEAPPAPVPLKLDLGCGPNKRPGFYGVDLRSFPGVDLVLNLGVDPWPFEEGSIEETHSMHFLEHLTMPERVHLMNELYRVLKVDGKAFFQVPAWSSARAYGDPTHQWPPVSEWFLYYLRRDWRATNAPHTDIAHNPTGGFSCHFDAAGSFALHQDVTPKNEETQRFMLTFYKEAAQDLMFTLTKLK
jgi:hypothetical protein